MEASVIPLISPGHETLSFLYEDFYTTLRVGAGSCLLPQNLQQQEGKPAPSFHTPQNPCTQVAHSEFMAPEEAAEGICLGCSSLIPALGSPFFLGFCQSPPNPFGKSF